MRIFHYLDDRVVEQFLAQAEGGLYDEQRSIDAHAKSKKGEASIGAGPLRAGAGAGGDARSEVETVTRQTPESRFNRLYHALEGDMQSFNEASVDVFGSVRARDLIEVDCYVDVPSASRALAGIEQFEGLSELMRQIAPDKVDAETQRAIEGMSRLAASSRGSFVATAEISENECNLAFKLDRDHLRIASVEDLEGEAAVLGKVDRKLLEGQEYPLLGLPGMNLMSRADRRRQAKSKKPTQAADDSLVLKGPALILSVIAIYR